MDKRASGILLHVTSLPSPFGTGDLGPCAYRFADFLASAGQGFWQTLPLNPTCIESGNSPYASSSAFAGNPLLISPELLAFDGLLSEDEIRPAARFSEDRVEYARVIDFKGRLFDVAYKRFAEGSFREDEYGEFCEVNRHWLDDYALFRALCEYFGAGDWTQWPAEIRDRDAEAIEAITDKLREGVEKEKFLQYIFFRQWTALKEYCLVRNIRIIGDIPIYVNFNSADVWRNPHIFKLDDEKKPLYVSGVPPDYFSETGQLWNDPVYDWNALKKSGYSWWMERMEHNLKLYDIIRIDHFRGLAAYWEIPRGETTAVNGRWAAGPGADFLEALAERFFRLPIIAEDLGTITPDVRELIDRFGLPGMKVLLFAFGDNLATNPYVPHNHVQNCVVYTGTHDNNTVLGWFKNETSPEDRQRLWRYFGRAIPEETLPWEMVRMAMMSVARLAVIPMQDILGLDADCRMNTPSTTEGNWEWRLRESQLTPEIAAVLLDMTRTYGRT